MAKPRTAKIKSRVLPRVKVKPSKAGATSRLPLERMTDIPLTRGQLNAWNGVLRENLGAAKRPLRNELRCDDQKLSVPTLRRRTSGVVFGTGSNYVGQLGLKLSQELRSLEHIEHQDGDIYSVTRPVRVDFPHPVIDIAAGGMHSAILTEQGKVYTFGCNDEGALGRPTDDQTDEMTPQLVELPDLIVMLSAGDNHTAALSKKGKVYIWGNFKNGDSMIGITPDGRGSVTPIPILREKTILKISSGTEHLLCLSIEGTVYTIGCAFAGQLGRISKENLQTGGRMGFRSLLTPGEVRATVKTKKFSDVWSGSYTTYLRSEKQIYGCGLNNFCQLGYSDERSTVRPMLKYNKLFGRETEMIAGGQHHTISLDKQGRVFACGRRDYGRLGLGDIHEDVKKPTVIPALQNYSCCHVAAGETVSFAISGGKVFSWGMGSSGQLGLGDEEDRVIPTQIDGDFIDWYAIKVAAGGQHTLILAYRR